MKISELPKKIRKKALKYQNKCKDDLKTDLLVEAFPWRKTKEGFIYWNDLDEQEAPKEELKDTIVESVINQFKQRSEVGIKKYGVTLDRTDLSTLEWIQHAQEEAMDLCLYLEKIKQELKQFKNMVMFTEKDFAKFKKKPTQWYDEKLEERINIIGQNGNDGEHYKNK